MSLSPAGGAPQEKGDVELVVGDIW